MAIERACLHWDVYVNENILASTRSDDPVTRFHEIVRMGNLNQSRNRTYDDRLAELDAKRDSHFVDSPALITSEPVMVEQAVPEPIPVMPDPVYEIEEPDDAEVPKDTPRGVSDRIKNRWWPGFSDDDYKYLETEYNSLRADIPINDHIMEDNVRQLCVLNLFMIENMRNGNADALIKLSKEYQAKLKFIKNELSAKKESDLSESSFGLFLREIEQHTPAEYFQDKKLYADADGLGTYFDRFIARATNNIMTDTNVPDPEYSVESGGDS
jgi:hypothetical protein